MSKFIVTDEQRRRIAEKTGTISRTKNENAWQFVVTDEARRRLEQNREKKLLEEERRRALAPYAGAWVDRQLQRTVGLIDNEKIDPAAKTQTETRTPLYEMSFPRVSSPQLERKTSERIAARNAAVQQDTPLLPSERAVSNLQTRPYTPETTRREVSVLGQKRTPASAQNAADSNTDMYTAGWYSEQEKKAAAAVAQNAETRAERVKTWDTQEYGKLNTEYEQRQADYDQRKQSYIRRQFDSADFSMGDTAAAQVFYKQAAEEYDRQNAAAREETNQLGEYLKSRKESEDLKADLRQIQLYTDEWKNVDNNRGVPENAAVYEAMNGRWTQAKVDNILKGTSSEAYVSDTERNVVAYLLATGRDQDAIQFAQTLDKRILNARQEIDIHKKAQAEAQRIAAIDNGFVRSLASAWQAVQGGYDSVISQLQNFGRGILGSDDLRTGVNELANAYNIERVEGETWVGATLLKALTAGIEMTPAIGAGMLTGGMGTVAGMSVSNLAAGGTLFAQAAGGSYAEAIRDGYSVGEARMYGVLTGSMEVLTNKFLGGVKGLTSESTAVKSIRKTVESASKKLIKNPTGQKLLNILGTYAGEGASEGIEELIQAIAEPVVRDFVFNEQNGIQLSAESFEEALIGALTAWMINAPATGVQSIRTLASRNSSAVNRQQSLNDAPADGSIAAEVANAPDSSVDVKARDALRTLYQGRQISNSQAEAILDSPAVLAELQRRAGITIDTTNTTKSQRRAAVKNAALSISPDGQVVRADNADSPDLTPEQQVIYDDLQTAKQMQAEGKTGGEIYNETKWVAMNGKWAYNFDHILPSGESADIILAKDGEINGGQPRGLGVGVAPHREVSEGSGAVEAGSRPVSGQVRAKGTRSWEAASNAERNRITELVSSHFSTSEAQDMLQSFGSPEAFAAAIVNDYAQGRAVAERWSNIISDFDGLINGIDTVFGTPSDGNTNGIEAHDASVEESPPPRTAPEGKIKSKTTIIRRIRRDLGITAHTGDMFLKGALGEHVQNSGAIHTKRANDLESFTHEVGHELDKRFSLRADLDAETQRELIDNAQKHLVSYPNSSEHLPEAVAEYFRNYFRDAQGAEAAYPNFSSVVQSRIDPKTLKKINFNAADVNRYLSSSGLERARTHIVSHGETDKGAASPIDAVTDKWEHRAEAYRINMTDKLAGIQKLMQQARKSVLANNSASKESAALLELNNAYMQAMNAEYATGAAQFIIEQGLTDSDGNIVADSLQSRLKDVNLRDRAVYKDFNLYLVLRHAEERLKSAPVKFGVEEFDNPAKRREAIAELEKQHPEFAAAADKITEFNFQLLQYRAVKDGIISQETLNEWKQRWPHYVPLFRDMSSDTDFLDAFMSDASGSGDSFKKAKGSARDIYAPLESIVQNTYHIIQQGNRNRITNLIMDTAEYAGDLSWMIEAVPNIQHEQGYVTYYRNGQQRCARVNDWALYQSIQAMRPENADRLTRMIAATNHFFTATVTGNNILWSLGRNLVRDLQTLLRNQDSAKDIVGIVKELFGVWLRPVGQRAKTIKAKITQQPSAETNSDAARYEREFLAMGGYSGVSQLSSLSPKKMSRSLTGYHGNIAARGKDIYLSISDIIERKPRAAQYVRLRRKGYNATQAFYEAMDVTTNFRRAGIAGRKINQFIPFFNAGIQGSSKMYRSVLGRGEGIHTGGRAAIRHTVLRFTWSAVFAAAQIGGIALWFGGDDDDEERIEAYKRLSTYQKNNNYNIYIGNGRFLSIGKPRELGILGSAMERLGEMWFLDNEDAFYDFFNYAGDQALPKLFDMIPALWTGWADGDWDDFMGSFWSSFGFLGAVGGAMANVDYRGNPIVPGYMENIKAKQQFDENSSWLSVQLGKALNISPMRLDHIANSAGILHDLSSALFPYDRSKVDWSLGMRGMLTKDSLYTQDATNRFYAAYDDAERAKNSNPSDVSAAIEYKDYASMSTFLSRASTLSKQAEMESSQNRDARLTIIQMTEQFNKDHQTGDYSDVKLLLDEFAQEVADLNEEEGAEPTDGITEFYPQTMNTEFKYGKNFTHQLTYTEYIDYQTKYLDQYYKEVADALTSDASTEQKLVAVKKAKVRAKKITDQALYEYLTKTN